MPTKFKIFDIRKVPSADPARVGKYDRMPEDEFTEERMLQAIKEDIAERAKFTGKEYEVA
ncbi:hypothetical protein ES703_119559 [subsurface metagenome]